MTNTTTLSLVDRPCKIGSSINTRTQKHGDEDVPACDIPIVGFLLEAAELDAFLGKGTHKLLYRDAKGNSIEPRIDLVSELAIDEKFVGTVSLDLPNIELELDGDNVTFASVKLEPKVGGLTAMSLQVQCTPSVDEIAQLVSALNREIRASINFGGRKQPKGKKQKELPMGAHTQQPPTDGTNGAAEETPAATH